MLFDNVEKCTFSGPFHNDRADGRGYRPFTIAPEHRNAIGKRRQRLPATILEFRSSDSIGGISNTVCWPELNHDTIPVELGFVKRTSIANVDDMQRAGWMEH